MKNTIIVLEIGYLDAIIFLKCSFLFKGFFF